MAARPCTVSRDSQNTAIGFCYNTPPLRLPPPFTLPGCVALSWNGPDSFFHDNVCNFKCNAPKESVVSNKGEVAAILHPGKNACGTPPPPPPPQQPGWNPPGWAAGYADGSLLNSTASDNSAQVGNGYVAFFVQAGSEFVAGVFTGKLTNRATSHRASIPSVLTVTSITAATGSSINSTIAATATAIDLENDAYVTAFAAASASASTETQQPAAFVSCEQKLYAHRARAHLLVLEVTCSNPTDGAVVVSLDGPNTADSNDGLAIKPAATGLKATKCWTGTVTATEVNTTSVPVVGFCHDDVKSSASATLTVPAGGAATTMLLSARYTTIDTDSTYSHIPPPSLVPSLVHITRTITIDADGTHVLACVRA